MTQNNAGDLGIQKGERRQLTALFYDLVGSTSMVTNMDLEDYREVQQALHQAAHHAIAGHGGHLDLLMGDGGSAYFGYPIADEDAPQRAVAAGLAILKERADIQKRFDCDIQVRVGVATGPAVSGPAGSGALADREEIIGIAPTLAARIQGIAQVGTVAVSNATYRATRRIYHYESLGAHSLKGFDQPQSLWQPLGRRETVDRFEKLRDAGQPFLARRDELEEATDRWQQASHGEGQVLYVHGEPGIGKSRLSFQVAQQARDEGAHLLDFQCEPECRDIPFSPFVKSLRAEIRRYDPSFDFETPSAEAIADVLSLPGDQSPEFYKALAFLLSPSPQQDDADPNPASSVDTLVDAVMAIASAKPCVIKLEDLHWADSQTIEVLEHLLDRIASAPVFIVVTSRERPEPKWTELPHFSKLRLSRLGEDSIIELIGNVAGAAALSPRLAHAIAARCEGVPLFAEELTRFVVDRGAEKMSDESAWESLFDSEETASLQDLLAARLAALGKAKIVAQAASVIGRSFNILTLVALLASTGTPASADESLNQLMAGGFIEKHSNEAEPAYRFRHMLLQQAAYAGLLRANRRTLHTALYRIATGNEASGQPFTSAELAVHAEQARMPVAAARHYIDAARSASSQSALKEARTHLTRARSIAEKISDKAVAAELELEIVKLLGPVVATMDGTGSEEASALYQRGVELLHETPETHRATGFPLYWGWWFTAANFKEQRERAETILSDLTGVNDKEIELQAHHCRWATAFNLGNHNDCLEAISKGLDLYSEDEALEHRTRYGGHDARVCGLGEKALSSWFIGQTESAVSHMEQSDAWARHIDHVGSNCHALDIGIMLHRYRGDVDRVASLARRMKTAAVEHDLKSLEAKSLIFAGWSQGMSGDPERGRANLTEGLSIQQEIGTEEDFPVYLEMAGELDAMLGRFDNGLAVLSSAIERAEATGHAFWLAELYRRRARLGARAGSGADQILTDLAKAEDVALNQNAKVLVLRALADLVMLQPDKATPGHLERAQRILQELEQGSEKARISALLASRLS